jgi:hypothetical protein
MFGTFVPIHAGHLPIDFYLEKKYNLFERLKKIRTTGILAPGEKVVNLVDLAGPPARFVGGFEPAASPERWRKL